jgi:uncharacterized protein YecE (DUF72 family)
MPSGRVREPAHPGRGTVLVGTSGWRYAGWRGDFYPQGLRQREELAYLSRALTSVEVNGSFYSLQRPSSYAAWAGETPEDFVFAVKGGRFITHMRALRDVETALANFFASGVLALGAKLGPVLWQLPARLSFDEGRLAEFFRLLPRTTEQAAELARRHDDKVPEGRALTQALSSAPIRHALEPRHESFASDAALELLRRNEIGTVIADSAGTWPQLDAITSDLVYVRLHGDTELYASGYSTAVLEEWAARIRDWTSRGLDVVVYFDNDAKGHAPHDAAQLQEILGIARVGEGETRIAGLPARP